MIDYTYKDLFEQDTADKQLNIVTDDGLVEITNSELHSENFELTESLCSESELRFGTCEASVVKFKVSNIFSSLKGKWLTITETLAGNTSEPFQFGKYKVFSDVPTADRSWRNVTAYDALYDIINADVASWYNTILPTADSTTTMLEFRTSFISHFGLEQKEITLANDDMVITKTVEPSQMSGRDVITAICEINGCFGHIGRDGKFEYVYLAQNMSGLYPSNTLYPANDLYPIDPKSSLIKKSIYINATYEDYVVKGITKLQIRENENDIGKIYPDDTKLETDNCYIVEDNFLVYGKSTEELSVIAKNLFEKIKYIVYRPCSVKALGNPCLEVGDGIRLSTRNKLVESYILERTITGIQALRDSFSAEGKEIYDVQINSTHKSIIQLKGKTNELERTIEQTQSTITDVEKGLQTQITQTASSLQSDIEDTKKGLESSITQTAEEFSTKLQNTESNLQSDISQTASQIETQVAQTYETKEDASSQYTKLNSSITQTASSIKSEVTNEVSNKYETKENASSQYTKLNSSIEQTAESISSEVTRATNAENNLSSRVEQTVQKISLKVNNGSVSSGIVITVTNEDGSTEEVKGTIELTGVVTFNDLETSGKTVINGDNITTGQITAITLNGCTMNGGAISIGGNNVIMNEAGIWVIGSGTAESPKFRVDNDGNLTLGGTAYMTNNVVVTGELSATNINASGGKIGNWAIGSGAIANNGVVLTSDGSLALSSDNNQIRLGSSVVMVPTALKYGSDSIAWNFVVKAGQAQVSDERIKQNINPITDDYEEIFDSLEPKTYQYTDGSGFDSTKTHIGFIAQEIQELTNGMDLAVLNDDNAELLGVDKQELIALNTWQIQKIKQRLDVIEQILGIKEM